MKDGAVGFNVRNTAISFISCLSSQAMKLASGIPKCLRHGSVDPVAYRFTPTLALDMYCIRSIIYCITRLKHKDSMIQSKETMERPHHTLPLVVSYDEGSKNKYGQCKWSQNRPK